MDLDLQYPTYSVWKIDCKTLLLVSVYRMQLDAPVPIPVISTDVSLDTPSYLGRDYHRGISHIEVANQLNSQPNGAYVVRKSRFSNGQFHTLSLKFNDQIHHYKVYYDSNSGLYVREKRYDCVRLLVVDGLVTMYLELRAPLFMQKLSTVNYQESLYMTLNKRNLQTLTKERSM